MRLLWLKPEAGGVARRPGRSELFKLCLGQRLFRVLISKRGLNLENSVLVGFELTADPFKASAQPRELDDVVRRGLALVPDRS